MRLSRTLKHLATPHWAAGRVFRPHVLKRIEEAVKASERHHDGELRFAVEAGLPVHALTASSRHRAEDLFSQLRVWDTEHNNGVLIYVQLVDRKIEIIADRGIAAKVPQAEWSAICRAMERAFGESLFLEGSLAAIDAITRILALRFPPRGRNPNELSDKPVVL